MAFVFGCLAATAAGMLVVDYVMMLMEIFNRTTGEGEMCCMSMVFLWIATLMLGFLGILFNSVSFYRVKTGYYAPEKRAMWGFVLSLVSGSVFVLLHILSVVLLVVFAF